MVAEIVNPLKNKTFYIISNKPPWWPTGIPFQRSNTSELTNMQSVACDYATCSYAHNYCIDNKNVWNTDEYCLYYM